MKATIIIHQGFADIFTNNGIINYYCDIYDELIIFVLDEYRKKLLEFIFNDRKNIKIIIPIFKNICNNIDTCLNCITYGNSSICPRESNIKCKYIDYSYYSDYTNIKIGGFNNYNDWEKFKSQKYYENISFSHCFYLYNNINIDNRINNFKFFRNYEIENNNYNNLINKIGNKYIIIHEDNERNIIINKNYIENNNYILYNLDKKSDNMVDQIKILENSEEIHLIDSNYSVLIYFLCFNNDILKTKKIYLHTYMRNERDILIYTSPIPNNWIFLK
jgi:hypothetical protein